MLSRGVWIVLLGPLLMVFVAFLYVIIAHHYHIKNQDFINQVFEEIIYEETGQHINLLPDNLIDVYHKVNP